MSAKFRLSLLAALPCLLLPSVATAEPEPPAWLARNMPQALRGSVLDVEVWQYLAIFLLLILGLVLRRVALYLLKRRITALVELTEREWLARLVEAASAPLATLIMAVVLRIGYPKLGLAEGMVGALEVAVRVLVVVSLVWATYRFVEVLADRLAAKAETTDSKLDDQLVPLVRRSLKAFVVVAGALFILQNLNVNVGSLLAGLGIGGLAVALAAKDTIANFFGSIMIFVDRPFQIGDWIVVDGVEGIVEEVGFRSTRIRTFQNSLVTLPNARFTETKIDNFGARQYRRVFVTLNLTYDTTPEQMQAFVEGVRAILQANPSTRKDYYEVHMSGFGAHSLDVMLYFFFEVPSWSDELRERHNVFLEIMRLARELGVAFAFPTRTLHLEPTAQTASERRATEELARVVADFAPGGGLSRPRGPKLTHGYLASLTPAAQSAGDDG